MAHKLTETVEALSEPSSLKGLFHQHKDGYPLPSSTALEDIIQLARAILFPGYFGKSQVNVKTIKYQIGVNVERLQNCLPNRFWPECASPTTTIIPRKNLLLTLVS